MSVNVRFNDIVLGGIFTGLSLAQMNAWHQMVDSYIVYVIGPIEGDPGIATVRAFIVTGMTICAGWVIHRCCRCVEPIEQ